MVKSAIIPKLTLPECQHIPAPTRMIIGFFTDVIIFTSTKFILWTYLFGLACWMITYFSCTSVIIIGVVIRLWLFMPKLTEVSNFTVTMEGEFSTNFADISSGFRL